MSYDCTEDVQAHRAAVIARLQRVIDALQDRASIHDLSKLLPPEKSIFDKYTPRLKEVEFGGPEYVDSLRGMKDGLTHHYEVNRHHPEHFPRGVRGMTLVDLIEMVCDWEAAANAKGTRVDAAILFKRFNINSELADVIVNTLIEDGA